jgi:uncharacterized protein
MRTSFRCVILAAVLALTVGTLIFIRPSIGFILSIFPKHKRITSEDRQTAAELLGSVRDVTFTTEDKIEIRGWYVPPRNGALVILVHGGSANRAQMLPEAVALTRKDFGVLIYDSRASGESGGTRMTWGDREQFDLKAAIAFIVENSRGLPNKIGVQGFSIGATTTALTAASDSRIDAVLLNAVWTRLADEIRSKLGPQRYLGAELTIGIFNLLGVNVGGTDVIASIGKISPRPLLMLVGDEDQDTPRAVTEVVFEKAKMPKEFAWVKHAGHGHYAEANPEYLQAVTSFFQRALLGFP